jgi:branched-chain amino acid transport system substrate-binding protein
LRHNIIRGTQLLAVTAALALSVTACGGNKSESSNAGGELKLAYFGAKTGDNAQLGLNELNGVKLALKQHNAKSGVTKVSLLEYDSAGDPAQATPLAPKVAKSGVVGVVGLPFSGESKVAVPVLNDAGIPSISPSATNVKLAANGWKTWHRVVANDDIQGPGAAQFIQSGLGAKKVAVVDDQTEYGKGIADAVRKTLGSAVVANDSVPQKTDDYSPTVNRIKPKNVDAIFYGGYYADASKLLKALRNGGVQAKFVSGDGSLDLQLVKLAGPASEGAFLACPCNVSVESSDPDVKKFIDAYKAEYNADPATYSAEGYDAANAFLMAIDAGKKTPSEINDYLATIDFKGASKQIKFDANGELAAKEVFMHEIKGGKIVSLGPASTAKPLS